MASRAEDLLAVEHFHVVFTLPAEIVRIALWNKQTICGLLFIASAETIKTIAADPNQLGAGIGMTSVLHTWGSALTHHPDIHMIQRVAACPWTVSGGLCASLGSFCMFARCRVCSSGCLSKA